MPPTMKQGLPPPPSQKLQTRPLPSEPQFGGDGDDELPPLPPRPVQNPSLPQPPPIGKSKQPQTPQSSDDEGLQTYEEPDVNVAPRQQSLPPPHEDELFEQQLTYDDLQDVMAQPSPPNDNGPTEKYDEFQMKTETTKTSEDDQLYEGTEDDVEEPAAVESSEDFYEFVQDSTTGGPLSPSPSFNTPIPPQQPPPKHHQAMPPSPENMPEIPPTQPLRNQPHAHPPRNQPVTKNLAKKLSVDGTPKLEISQAQLDLQKSTLRKVSSVDGEKPKEEKADLSLSEANSVQDNIQKFKQGGLGGKPIMPSHPQTSQRKSRNLGPPPPPPTKPMASLPFPPLPQWSDLQSGMPSSAPSTIWVPEIGANTSCAVETMSRSEQASIPVVAPQFSQPIPVPEVGKSSVPSRPSVSVYDNTCDDIYDDAESCAPDPLGKEEWYFGDIERAEAEQKLKDLGLNGAFLVRKSRQGGDTQPYTLVVLFEKRTYNLKMRLRSDRQVALGEVKAEERSFTDVPALINHHTRNDVILVNKTENKQHKTLLKNVFKTMK